MEDSATTAIYTGAFVMIFVSSLTLSIFLFNSILDFSNLAYEYNTKIAENETIVNVPVGSERLISAEEVASYYYNYVSYDLYNEERQDDKFNVKIYCKSTKETSGSLLKSGDYTYKELIEKIGPNTTYILSYDSIDENNKAVIIIKQATEEQINSML